VAVGVPGLIENPTNEKVTQFIKDMGYSINPMKGVQGNFYRKNRCQDLKNLCREILYNRDSD
jgi:hypothetical protein